MRLLGVSRHYENDVNPEGEKPADDNREDEECSASALCNRTRKQCTLITLENVPTS